MGGNEAENEGEPLTQTGAMNGNLTQSQQLEAMQPFRGQKVNFSSRIYTVLGVPPAQEEVG